MALWTFVLLLFDEEEEVDDFLLVDWDEEEEEEEEEENCLRTTRELTIEDDKADIISLIQARAVVKEKY